MKKIALLTSGGDSPGMNAAIRSIVRTCLFHNIIPIGIKRGYQGLLDDELIEMNASSVGNILQQGGTILRSSRCKEFFEKEYRAKAAEVLKKNNIDALIVIGGDGSFNGAYELSREHQIKVIGIPGTIDNDIKGTEYTIGFDTAVQNAVEAVDKIRDTASSHDRNFIIEVMGRQSSAIALTTGVCTGAEWVVTPNQNDVGIAQIVSSINSGIKRGKNSSIIIVAEGKQSGLSYKIHNELIEQHGIESKVCVLGHIQRGGRPSALDRINASKMGNLAVLSLINGKAQKAIVELDGKITTNDLSNCLSRAQVSHSELKDLVKVLSI